MLLQTNLAQQTGDIELVRSFWTISDTGQGKKVMTTGYSSGRDFFFATETTGSAGGGTP